MPGSFCHFKFESLPVYGTDLCSWFVIGLSYAVDQLACLSMPTACIITMLDQICLVLCKPHSSLVTWLASAMVSFWCLGLLDFALLCSLFVTFTGQSSVSSTWVDLTGKFIFVFPLHHREKVYDFCQKIRLEECHQKQRKQTWEVNWVF